MTGERGTKPGDPGTCGFCGTGDGWLGDQGDETSVHMLSTVRTGEPGNWKYDQHPGALKSYPQKIIWCGHCVGGLKHMFQREDDHNLNAEYLALSMWLEMDGPRWGAWNAVTDEQRAIAKKYADDPAIHLDKLHRERRLSLIEKERSRRAGFDLTTRGWRP